MKRLFLMRHAKSSWDHPGLSDFERPLNKRGFKAAPRIGSEIQNRGYIPELIVSSPAERALQTSNLVREAVGFGDDIRYDRRIYAASVNSLIYIISEIGDSFQNALLVGHNPGFEDLLAVLTGINKRMPTAAFAAVDTNAKVWSNVSSGAGSLVDFIIPRDLRD
jgi:phosphohistidine phosphatase